MIRNKLNNLIEKKYFLVIFSVLISMALWMYVTYVENPEDTNYVSGINIEFEGEEALRENNLLITNADRNTVNILFAGRRNSVIQLNNSNVTVTADLNDILEAGGATGVYQLSYEVNYPSGFSSSFISIQDANADYITVTVEELATVEVPVRGVFNGSVAEGYQAEPMEVQPETIEISGPAAAIAQVAAAQVVVDVQNLSETYTEEVELTLVDQNGEEIDNSEIIMEQETVVIRIPVIVVKTLELAVDFRYTNAITADNFDEHVRVTISPANITLAGEEAVLEELDSVRIGEIDLSDFASTTRETFQIPIPNDLQNVTGTTEATVTVEITGFEAADYSATDISVTNVTNGYTARIDTQSLYVRLRGTESDLDAITPANIRVVADLSELGNTTGTYSVLARVYVDGYTNVDAIGDSYITVTISRS